MNAKNLTTMTVEEHKNIEKYLFISCYSDSDKQFSGIERAMNILIADRRVKHLHWNNRNFLDLTGSSFKHSILISGHGKSNQAGIGNNNNIPEHILEPSKLKMPENSRLFLLCCYQGKRDIIEKWHTGTGVEKKNIFGCTGETESALSTIFFINLIEYGVETLQDKFNLWLKANEVLRPYFPFIRNTYRETHANPLLSLNKIIKRISFTNDNTTRYNSNLLDFIKPAFNYTALLEDLI